MKSSPFLKLEIPVTFKDQPGVQSALLYTDIRVCNLNCYQCHNRASYQGKGEVYSYDELKEKLNLLKLLGVELIIISGGEPTLIESLPEGLLFLKEEGFKVRLDTNGTNPEVVAKLLKKELVDGFAVDIKIPIFLNLKYSAPSQLKRFKTILYSTDKVPNEKIFNYAEKLKLTVEIVENAKLPYNLFRTVKYPLLTEEEVSLIKKGIQYTPHQLNPFYPVEER